jgi:anti-sigma factor RsiW
MKCVEVEQQLDYLINGELSPFYQKQVENHLENCQLCHQHLEKLQNVSGLLKNNLLVATSPLFDERMMQLLNQHQVKKTEKIKPVGIFATIFAGVSIPKPIFALALLTLAVMTGLAFQLGRMTSTNVQTQILQTEKTNNLANPTPQIAESVQTKIVKIPVTKYVKVPVIQEKIVTRTVYKTASSNKKEINKTQTANLDNLAIDKTKKNEVLTQISLKDYQPVSEIKMKIFKRGENSNE